MNILQAGWQFFIVKLLIAFHMLRQGGARLADEERGAAKRRGRGLGRRNH